MCSNGNLTLVIFREDAMALDCLTTLESLGLTHTDADEFTTDMVLLE